jgi:hypothetical protein
MRGWQALCILSRFVTTELAEIVCNKTFLAMGKGSLHSQIRYFVEIFTIQCARRHPLVFGKALVEQITRVDLSLQMTSSLMIIGGNLIVGRYEADFFRQDKGEGETLSVDLDLFLSGVIPWLSSTQGFSRAIAQLLVHKLIPLVVDVTVSSSERDSDWYLRLIYHFLEENSDMKRLRRKQSKFFFGYDADSACTPEGIFSTPVDDGGEADPQNMVEVIKACLKEVYLEAHIDSTPSWKQLQKASSTQQIDVEESLKGRDVVNFQRKIIPLDALNLSLEELRENRLRNAAGRQRQPLIVCASLVDKVPNLGGLARTAEIFGADRLVVPDILQTKLDNFKSLSVGAADWIEIEECREEVGSTMLAGFLFHLPV